MPMITSVERGVTGLNVPFMENGCYNGPFKPPTVSRLLGAKEKRERVEWLERRGIDMTGELSLPK